MIATVEQHHYAYKYNKDPSHPINCMSGRFLVKSSWIIGTSVDGEASTDSYKKIFNGMRIAC